MEKTGAVLVAAGLSSRMKAFKPLLPYENSTISFHTVMMLKALGVSPIVVVTGYRADELEESLSGTGVLFERNNNYRSSQMLDSVKIGLRSIITECERILIMPMDVPGITDETFQKILKVKGKVTRTCYHEKPGHPIILESEFAKTILSYTGENGLGGAIKQSGVAICDVEVNDEGVIRDVDTPEEYKELLDWKCSSKKRIPDLLECERLWKKYNTSKRVIEHCKAVAEQADCITTKLIGNGNQVNGNLIRSAALLHDIVRNQIVHPSAGFAILTREGYDDIADIVRQHHYLEDTASLEAMVVYLADKEVYDTTVVDVVERYNQSLRKCSTLDAVVAHEIRRKQTIKVEHYIESLCGMAVGAE